VDEINGAPAKVQSALLEAMEERQVTVAGTTHRLPDLFMDMATKNPIEQEGTYPLPEAQLDRFLMHVKVDYLPDADERAILRLVREEERAARGGVPAAAPLPIPKEAIFAARAEMAALHVADAIDDYVVALVCATRRPGDSEADLGKWSEVGSSPRASIALDRTARVHAWLAGQDHVTPENVRAVASDVLRHRLILTYEASADRVSPDAVLERILSLVAVA
jgi:MoxR-like ATPase